MYSSLTQVGVLGYGQIEQLKVRFSFLRVNVDEAFAIWRPDRLILSTCPRRRAVANQESGHIEIKVRGQIARLCIWRKIEDPEVGLRV